MEKQWVGERKTCMYEALWILTDKSIFKFKDLILPSNSDGFI